MNNKIEKLKENLTKDCCHNCTHLSLEGPYENNKYDIKCVILNSLPNSDNGCDYFSPQNNYNI